MVGILAILKGAVSSAVAALPLLRRLAAERKAGADPYSSTPYLADDLLDGALGRLGALTPEDPIWDKVLSGAGGLITRPEEFTKPHVREWVSLSNVRSSLKEVCKCRVTGAREKAEDLELLATTYVKVSGEDKRHAEGMIEVALAFLKASLENAPKDKALAAMVQTGFVGASAQLAQMQTEVRALAQRPNLILDASLAEHHGADASRDLQGILRRRTSPGQDPLAELRRLAENLEAGGKYFGASNSIKAEVYNWIARLAAGDGRRQEAVEAIERLAALGCAPCEIALAWMEVAEGKVDGALRRLRNIDGPDSRSNLFTILLRYRGTGDALAYFEGLQPVAQDAFTPVGWKNVAVCLAEDGRISLATELLSSLPDYIANDCPPLGFVRGLFYLAHLVPEAYRQRVIREQFFGASEHLLEGTEVDEWRRRAQTAFEMARGG